GMEKKAPAIQRHDTGQTEFLMGRSVIHGSTKTRCSRRHEFTLRIYFRAVGVELERCLIGDGDGKAGIGNGSFDIEEKRWRDGPKRRV
ncbi:hypothetical protein ALC60_02666, partial [Trachymyrmex zeteki]